MKRAALLLLLLLSLTTGIAHEPVRVDAYLWPDGTLKVDELPEGVLNFSGFQARMAYWRQHTLCLDIIYFMRK